MVDGFLLMAGTLGDTVSRGNWTEPGDMSCFTEEIQPWAEGPDARHHLMQV